MTLGPVEGKHTPAAYLSLCAQIHEGALGGFVRVQNGRHWRRIWWVAGSPVWFESNVPGEQLGASLVALGLLDEVRLLELQEEAGDAGTLRDVLLRHDDVAPDVLHEHLRGQVARGVSSPLIWPRRECSYEPLMALPAGILRSAVLATDPPLQLLWQGAQAAIRMDQVLPWVSDPAAGGIEPTPALSSILPALLDGSGLDSLVEPLGQPTTVNALFMKVPDRSEALIVLLWFLELTGHIRRQGGDRRPELPAGKPEPALPPSPASSRPGASRPGASRPGASRPGAAAASRPGASRPGAAAASRPGAYARSRPGSSVPGGKAPATPQQIEMALRADHKRRMNKDYYAFLGLESTASIQELEVRANKLVNRWMRALKSRKTPPRGREFAEELLGTVRLVWRTLSDDSRRVEYDKRLARGQAPKAGGIRAANVTSITSGTHPALKKRAADPYAAVGTLGHREAVRMMDEGDFDRAAGILRRLRQEQPSDPDVLADLGWAEWRTAKGDPDKQESAEDYVRLALTFHPDHPRALEFLARIALDQKDIDGARGRLRAVLRVTPDARWAKASLDALPE